LLAKVEELNNSLASLRIENEKLIAKAKDLGAVWFKKCNANGNGNGFGSITGGNKFE
jgi:hypothetical protein